MRSFLQDLIVEELTTRDEPDPRLIANYVQRRIPDAQLREALDECLVHEVREAIRRERNVGTSQPPLRTASMSERWRTVSDAVMRERYWAASAWKMLGHCTPHDVWAIASEYERRASEQQAYADRFKALAEAMEAAGAATVAEFGGLATDSILHPERTAHVA